MVLAWEKLAVPFTVDIGDIHGRILGQFREAIRTRKADDIRPLNQAAGYVLTFKLQPNYAEAVGWIDEALKVRETFGSLGPKARILSAMGRKQEAITTGERAIVVGKAANPPADTSDFERILSEIRAGK